MAVPARQSPAVPYGSVLPLTKFLTSGLVRIPSVDVSPILALRDSPLTELCFEFAFPLLFSLLPAVSSEPWERFIAS
jgi:hypothetical protein